MSLALESRDHVLDGHELRWEDLGGPLAIHVHLPGAVNHSKTASTDLIDDLVAVGQDMPCMVWLILAHNWMYMSLLWTSFERVYGEIPCWGKWIYRNSITTGKLRASEGITLYSKVRRMSPSFARPLLLTPRTL